MNNHWGTNYRAYQEGPTLFRFILRPHRKTSPAENTRFATGFSQPLLAARATGAKAPSQPLLRISADDVLVTGLKPSDDGRALIVRLFGAGKSTSTKIDWSAAVKTVYLSNTSERPGAKAQNRIDVPSSGLVTVRAEIK
jgi:alpha-mannosidase